MVGGSTPRPDRFTPTRKTSHVKTGANVVGNSTEINVRCYCCLQTKHSLIVTLNYANTKLSRLCFKPVNKFKTYFASYHREYFTYRPRFTLARKAEVCTRFWWGNLRERDQWGDQHVDGRIILRWIFRKWEGVLGTGWSWLRIVTGDGHLWML